MYEGDFVNDKYEGNGKYIWEDGDIYIGQFKNGLRNGKGTYYNIAEKYRNPCIDYLGQFEVGSINGEEAYCYEGYWFDDVVQYEPEFIDGLHPNAVIQNAILVLCLEEKKVK